MPPGFPSWGARSSGARISAFRTPSERQPWIATWWWFRWPRSWLVLWGRLYPATHRSAPTADPRLMTTGQRHRPDDGTPRTRPIKYNIAPLLVQCNRNIATHNQASVANETSSRRPSTLWHCVLLGRLAGALAKVLG